MLDKYFNITKVEFFLNIKFLLELSFKNYRTIYYIKYNFILV